MSFPCSSTPYFPQVRFAARMLATAALLGALNISAASSAVNSKPGGFQYFVGIVGNPSVPDISWSDEELEQIKALGVNMVQLSIAWGGKPANEVLNLEDLDAEQRAKWAFRIKQAKKHGLKTIAQFGVPRFISYNPLQPACILDPAILKKTEEQLTDFMTSFPEVDDVLVYTFDQQSWLCSEFGPCPRCSGVPLDDRVPGFLNMLNATMQKCRPNSRLWWKPWELTKGQVVMILDKVNPAHFGLVLNPSTSNEVYPFNDRSFKSDLGVKRFVQLAKVEALLRALLFDAERPSRDLKRRAIALLEQRGQLDALQAELALKLLSDAVRTVTRSDREPLLKALAVVRLAFPDVVVPGAVPM